MPVDKSVWVDYAKTAALRILADEAITEQQALAAWSDVDQEFFFRERAEDIASFTQSIIANQHPGTPVVVLRDVGVEIPVATQVFVHATDRQNIFAIIAAVLDQLQLNIQDARLHTTSDNRAFDVFYILDDENRPIGTDTNLCTLVADSLKQAIMDPSAVKFDISRRTSRQLKNFTLKTQTSLSNDTETNTTVLEVITPDRPGLLAHLASIFLRFGLNLYNAKISTLGERVEDTFYLTDFSHKPLTDEAFGQKLQQTICSELDARNSEDT